MKNYKPEYPVEKGRDKRSTPNYYDRCDYMGSRNNNYVIYAVAIVAVLAIAAAAVAYLDNGAAAPSKNESVTRQITDMAGRVLTVPATIDSVVATSPPVSNLIYMLAPDKLAGWNSAMNTTRYMPDEYKGLPVIGGWFGTYTGNYETFITLGPDVVFEAFSANNLDMTGTDANSSVAIRQKNMGTIPVVAITDSTDSTKYVPEIRYMGDLLGGDAKTNADRLIDFYTRVITRVNNTTATIPDGEKKRVYYAEGSKGLQTEPRGAAHAQLIDICGGYNVCDLPASLGNGMGMASVSMEQVIQWSPDVIVCSDPTFYASIYNDSLWKDIPAVKNGQVYMVPKAPLSWMDRPPGVNQIIGIPWLAKVLYPEKYQDVDVKSLAMEFYSDFYHYDITDEQATSILKASGMKDA